MIGHSLGRMESTTRNQQVYTVVYVHIAFAGSNTFAGALIMCNNTALDATGKACCSAQHYADPLDARCYTTPAQVLTPWLKNRAPCVVQSCNALAKPPPPHWHRSTLTALIRL